MRTFRSFSTPMLAVLFLGTATVQSACHRSSNKDYASDTTSVSRLTDTEWSFVELDSQPAGVGAEGKPATLTLVSTENRASGFAGCNRMMGGYTMTGSELRFSNMAMTRMACTDGMELENRVAAALEATRRYRVSGKTLELMAGDTVVARLDRK